MATPERPPGVDPDRWRDIRAHRAAAAAGIKWAEARQRDGWITLEVKVPYQSAWQFKQYLEARGAKVT